MTAMVESQPALAPAYQRARVDPIARLLAVADQAGVRFCWLGRTLRVAGLAALHPADQALIRERMPEIRARLAAPEVEVDPCETWGIEVELVTDAAVATAIVAHLPACVGMDIETTAREGQATADQPWLVITRKGTLAKNQQKSGDAVGLDPLKSEPRTVQIYNPRAKVVHVVDLRAVPIAALQNLWN